MGDLPERLEERWERIPGAAATKINRILKERREAAARIRSLEGENARLTALLPLQPEGEVVEACQAIENWFAPWGSWKTAWWEDFAGDDREYTSENFIKALGKQLRRASEAYAKRGIGTSSHPWDIAREPSLTNVQEAAAEIEALLPLQPEGEVVEALRQAYDFMNHQPTCKSNWRALPEYDCDCGLDETSDRVNQALRRASEAYAKRHAD